MTKSERQTVVILGVTADIGRELALRYKRDGWNVIGLGRSEERLAQIRREIDIATVPCDLLDSDSMRQAIASFREISETWDLFVSCAGTMEPIGPFLETNFDLWEASIVANFCSQARILHGIWGRRRTGGQTHVVFLAGGGTNGAFTNYSAYCVSKIALIKLCELLDDEENDLNALAIGPGFVQTRIHEETIRAGAAAGANLEKTLNFYRTPGTSFDDIYSHIGWCVAAGRSVTGGRNFSTVHDSWRDMSDTAKSSIQADPDAFRLRRRQPK